MKSVDPPIAPRDAAGAEALIVSAYEAHHAELFAFLARSTRDRAVAEDLLRETFLRFTRETRDERVPDQVRGLLYRIASNLVVERARRQASAKRRRVAAPAPEPRLLMTDRSTDIERALEGLSVDARVGLLLSGEGFRGDDIAAAIGQTAAATRTLLCLARGRVRVRRELFAAEGR
jgi:RNA polymerase sigma-70 factor (ECF subfamily)